MRSSTELDAADPLAGYRGRFVGADRDDVVAYLDGNSLGRPLSVTAARLAAFVDQQWGTRLIRGWADAWMDEPLRVGDRLGAAALGVGSGQVTIGDSTSVLLYKLVRAAVDDRAGRREIVMDRSNFPTDRFIIEGIAAERDLDLRWIDTEHASGVTVDDLDRVLSDRTAVVVLSHVAFRSGFLADAKAITRQVHDAGALMLWDVCHSVGVVPVELDRWGVDLAVGCTYKYLNGGPGAPAFAFVASRLQDRLSQPIWGWMGSAEPFEMPQGYAPADGIRRFLSGTPAIVAMQPMKDMIELIEEVGIAAVRRKSIALTEHAIGLVDEHLATLDARLASPRESGQRGSHVTVDHPVFRQVTDRLWAQSVMPDFRPPDGLRLGLSPLSTSFAEVEAGILAIRSELESLS